MRLTSFSDAAISRHRHVRAARDPARAGCVESWRGGAALLAERNRTTLAALAWTPQGEDA
jgi:hypothetical protein